MEFHNEGSAPSSTPPKNAHVSLALLHYPALDKNGKHVVTSFITLDLHDIARPVRAYELGSYYIIQPVDGQRLVIKKQLEYWLSPEGAKTNPTRNEVVSLVRLSYTLDEAIEDIFNRTGKRPKLIGTDARDYPFKIGYKDLSEILKNKEEQFLIVFGTGYGIPPELLRSFDYMLEPIKGAGDWNHLSVRNAVAIILDRLFSKNRC
ncbi:MAG: RNA methyltransferase [Aquificaceae bacterium]|nr:RNA methyltransferase [Aquificaceae bacterium]